jgi:hypothetical protein
VVSVKLSGSPQRHRDVKEVSIGAKVKTSFQISCRSTTANVGLHKLNMKSKSNSNLIENRVR